MGPVGFQDRRIRPLCHPSEAIMMGVFVRDDHRPRPSDTTADTNVAGGPDRTAPTRASVTVVPIPGYQDTMGPVLRATSGGNERTMKDITADLSREFGLTPEELDTRLPSGGSLFANRVHWATTYLKKAELLESTGRAHVRITQEGRAVLANPPARIDRAFLLRYPAFAAFVRARAPKELGEELGSDILVSPPDASETSTPRERIDAAAKELSLDLADELLRRSRQDHPSSSKVSSSICSGRWDTEGRRLGQPNSSVGAETQGSME